MSTADIVLIASTLFLAAVAIFGPAYADRFKDSRLRPVLEIHFHQSPPDCHATDALLVLSPSQKSKERCFIYRFRVVNTGKIQARKCEAVVEGLAIADDNGRFELYPRYTPVRLVWGSGFEEFVDINPRRHFFCDFFAIPSADFQKVHRDLYSAYVDLEYRPSFDLGIVLNVKSVFFSQPNRLPPGRYRIDVAIYSENADKVSKSFLVNWSGVWDRQEPQMFRECVVTFAGT